MEEQPLGIILDPLAFTVLIGVAIVLIILMTIITLRKIGVAKSKAEFKLAIFKHKAKTVTPLIFTVLFFGILASVFVENAFKLSIGPNSYSGTASLVFNDEYRLGNTNFAIISGSLMSVSYSDRYEGLPVAQIADNVSLPILSVGKEAVVNFVWFDLNKVELMFKYSGQLSGCNMVNEIYLILDGNHQYFVSSYTTAMDNSGLIYADITGSFVKILDFYEKMYGDMVITQQFESCMKVCITYCLTNDIGMSNTATQVYTIPITVGG